MNIELLLDYGKGYQCIDFKYFRRFRAREKFDLNDNCIFGDWKDLLEYSKFILCIFYISFSIHFCGELINQN